MLRLAALNFHGDDLVGVDVRGEVDLAEGSAADLPAELELAADDAVHARASGEANRFPPRAIVWTPAYAS